MRALTDWELIAVLIVIVAAATLIDDSAAKRWCDTYQFCENMEIAQNDEI